MRQEDDDQWFVVLKERPVLDAETLDMVTEAGAKFGGGWTEVHQHVFIDYVHQNEVIAKLRERGYKVAPLSDTTVYHPECGMCGLPPSERKK